MHRFALHPKDNRLNSLKRRINKSLWKILFRYNTLGFFRYSIYKYYCCHYYRQICRTQKHQIKDVKLTKKSLLYLFWNKIYNRAKRLRLRIAYLFEALLMELFLLSILSLEIKRYNRVYRHLILDCSTGQRK